MSWLTLTLLCGFSVASADAATKRFLSDYEPAQLVLVRLAFPATLLSPLLFLQSWPSLPPAFWGWMALALPLELTALSLYMRAITLSPLALTLPYLAFTPAVAMLIGWLLLGEEPSAQGAAGLALVVVGAWTLQAHRVRAGERLDLLAPLRAAGREPGSRMMLAVAAIYGLTSVIGKIGVGYLPGLLFGAFYDAMLAVAALLAFAARRPRQLPFLWRRPGAHLLVGIAAAGEVLTHFLALQYVETAYMIAVKRTSLLFGIVYGALLFREARLGQHLGAGALMVAGVALIALR